MGKIYIYYYSKYNNVQNLVFGSRWHLDIFPPQPLLNFYDSVMKLACIDSNMRFKYILPCAALDSSRVL